MTLWHTDTVTLGHFHTMTLTMWHTLKEALRHVPTTKSQWLQAMMSRCITMWYKMKCVVTLQCNAMHFVTHAGVWHWCLIPDWETHSDKLHNGSNLASYEQVIHFQQMTHLLPPPPNSQHHDHNHYNHPHQDHAHHAHDHQDQFVKERGLVMIPPHFLSSHFSLEAKTILCSAL